MRTILDSRVSHAINNLAVAISESTSNFRMGIDAITLIRLFEKYSKEDLKTIGTIYFRQDGQVTKLVKHNPPISDVTETFQDLLGQAVPVGEIKPFPNQTATQNNKLNTELINNKLAEIINGVRDLSYSEYYKVLATAITEALKKE